MHGMMLLSQNAMSLFIEVDGQKRGKLYWNWTLTCSVNVTVFDAHQHQVDLVHDMRRSALTQQA